MKIRRLSVEDNELLLKFFSGISRDEATRAFFRPHALDAEMADKICGFDALGAKDEYFAAFDGGKIV